jgi:hypothetical protein
VRSLRGPPLGSLRLGRALGREAELELAVWRRGAGYHNPFGRSPRGLGAPPEVALTLGEARLRALSAAGWRLGGAARLWRAGGATPGAPDGTGARLRLTAGVALAAGVTLAWHGGARRGPEPGGRWQRGGALAVTHGRPSGPRVTAHLGLRDVPARGSPARLGLSLVSPAVSGARGRVVVVRDGAWRARAAVAWQVRAGVCLRALYDVGPGRGGLRQRLGALLIATW